MCNIKFLDVELKVGDMVTIYSYEQKAGEYIVVQVGEGLYQLIGIYTFNRWNEDVFEKGTTGLELLGMLIEGSDSQIDSIDILPRDAYKLSLEVY